CGLACGPSTLRWRPPWLPARHSARRAGCHDAKMSQIVLGDADGHLVLRCRCQCRKDRLADLIVPPSAESRETAMSALTLKACMRRGHGSIMRTARALQLLHRIIACRSQ